MASNTSGGWTCAICTLVNSDRGSTCEACMGPRGSSSRGARPVHRVVLLQEEMMGPVAKKRRVSAPPARKVTSFSAESPLPQPRTPAANTPLAHTGVASSNSAPRRGISVVPTAAGSGSGSGAGVQQQRYAKLADGGAALAGSASPRRQPAAASRSRAGAGASAGETLPAVSYTRVGAGRSASHATRKPMWSVAGPPFAADASIGDSKIVNIVCGDVSIWIAAAATKANLPRGSMAAYGVAPPAAAANAPAAGGRRFARRTPRSATSPPTDDFDSPPRRVARPPPPTAKGNGTTGAPGRPRVHTPPPEPFPTEKAPKTHSWMMAPGARLADAAYQSRPPPPMAVAPTHVPEQPATAKGDAFGSPEGATASAAGLSQRMHDRLFNSMLAV